MAISEHIVKVTQAGGEHTAVDFNGSTVSWAALGAAIQTLDQQLTAAGLGQDAVIGLLGRNRLEPVAGFISILGAGRGLLLINALRPVGLVQQEVRELNLSCLLGSAEDLKPEVLDAARQAGTLVLEVSVSGGQVALKAQTTLGAGPFRTRDADTLIEIQTSGTTGAPKRIPVAEKTIESSLKDGVRTSKGAVEQVGLKPKGSPTLLFGPLVHTSGTFNTLMSVFEVRPIVLIEKFEVEQFRKILTTYRPKFVPLPPTAIKMLVDSEATKEELSSVLAVRAGTAALSVDLQKQFEGRFGVPVLTTYGATEFMGVATSWTLDDHKQFSATKLGSVGRASKGVEIRVIDPLNGEPLPANTQGILEAKLDRIDGGRNWIRTTDLARIDEDGFLYIMGRADDAIIRGGFKVMAGKVADVLKKYPGVFDAIVLGMPDERLGEVPMAMVEATPGEKLDAAAIKAFAKEQLVPYEVPAGIYVVDKLPRTVSDKVSRPDAKRLLEGLMAKA